MASHLLGAISRTATNLIEKNKSSGFGTEISSWAKQILPKKLELANAFA